VSFEEMRNKIKKFLDSHENETYQYLWDTKKVVLREKFTVMCTPIRKLENKH
jgi:hypothetical protein